MTLQTTIKQPVSMQGKGMHSGRLASVKIEPLPADSGIIFQRILQHKTVNIPAKWPYTELRFMSSGLREPLSKVRIRTTEHLMAAFYATNIDNALVKINEEEIPILDGCSKTFSQKLLDGGIHEQDKRRQYIRLLKPISINDERGHIMATPVDSEKIYLQGTIETNILGKSTWRGELNADNVYQQLSAARTYTPWHTAFSAFCLRTMPFFTVGRGCNLDNTHVIHQSININSKTHRTGIECVKHKTLDFVGDLMCLGHRLLANIRFYNTTHALNQAFVRALMYQPTHWEFYTQSRSLCEV